MTVELSFNGAAGTVTGSCYRIVHDRGNFLVDCGLFQGTKTERELNEKPFPFDPQALDFVLLTHAHIDHVGLVPRLYAKGYRGPLHATAATNGLIEYLLADGASIQESEADRENRKRQRRGDAPVPPLYTLADAEEALKHLERARDLRPPHAPLLSKLGGAYQKLGRHQEADAVLKQAASLSPVQAKLEEATRLFIAGKFRESEKLTQALVRENPDNVNAALLLARIAIMAKCFEDARVILERITQTKPRFVAAWHDLATVLKELHHYEEAVSILENAVNIEPNNALTHYYHGAALAMAARPEDAVDAYRTAVSLDSKIPGAHIGLGHVLKTVGDQEGGIEAYRQAIELRPNFGETYYSLSNLKTFRFNESEIEDMQTRLANDKLPLDCRVHFAFSIGKAFEDQKQYDHAFEHYALANQLHRDNNGSGHC